MKHDRTVNPSELQKSLSFENSQNDRVEMDHATFRELMNIKYALDKSSTVAITDGRGVLIYVNERFCEISGYSESELIGGKHSILNSGFHSKEFFGEMWRTIHSGEIWRGDIKNRKKDGTAYWVKTTIVPFLDDKGVPYQYVSIRNDITKNIEVERKLRENEELFRLISENITDLIGIFDMNGKFSYLSPSCVSMLNQDMNVMLDTTMTEWVHASDLQALQEELNEIASKKKQSSQIEFRFRTATGDFLHTETTINPIIDQWGSVHQFVFVARDNTERKNSEWTIHRLAYHDPLTELPNRRLFFKQLASEVEEARRMNNKLAVVVLDLDRFKYINDSWGHEIGDLILVEAAKRIRQSIREDDLIARIGGDEFTILLSDFKEDATVIGIAERIQSLFKEPFHIMGETHAISCSIGIAVYPRDGADTSELLSRADTALFNVKETGRRGYALFTPEMETRSLERILMENEMRKAIENEQFHLQFQPKINFLRREMVGMEALIRWEHPELGLISPGRFIPLAEETKLIVQIGKWVMQHSCEHNKLWQQAGFPLVRVSVNVSVKQLMEPDFVSMVQSILSETGLDAQWLEIEVTESAFVDVENAAFILREISNLGVHISVDDFGTGYSSFSYLKELPVDTLKIDKTFIDDIDTNEESRAIVKAVLTVAETLGLEVVAEGVEKEEQLAILIEDGCNQIQGYLFSKPLNPDDFEAYLKTSSQLLMKWKTDE